MYGPEAINPIKRMKKVIKRNKMAIPTGENFASCYMELCKQQRVRPLPVICVTLPHSLDLTTDRVKIHDWGPILNSLSLDRSLKSVSVRSRYQCRKPLEEINSEDKAINMGLKHKEPVVLTRYLLEWLTHSVAQCVRNSRALTWLELEGVPFPADCLAGLCVGLAGTASLRHLSLRRCCIGDNGCELVCRTVAELRTLRSLDLSECDLGENSARALAAALSRQKHSLYHETWKESLRYREPDLDAMPGLRRLTLNGNPRLGDRAVSKVIEAVRDSLWMKALDLQHCGLTDFIGREIINLLEDNTTLAIVDVRINWNLSEDTLREIFQRLEANNGCNAGSNSAEAYTWMSLTRNDDERNRVSAGGGIRKNRYEKRAENLFTPKTPFITRKITRRCCYDGDGIVRGTRISVPLVRRTVLCSGGKKPAPRNTTTTTTTNNNKNETLLDGESPTTQQPKISLRVDLQSRIDTGTRIIAERSNEKEIRSDNDDKETLGGGGGGEQASLTRVNKILRELSEGRIERERLLEETERTHMLLGEERIRRETAESKLRRMKENFLDLETTLKKKERETRGFLLVSERSLDDVTASFDRLLEMLESGDARIEGRRYTENEYSLARAEIRRGVANLIRKTKSESDGRRGFRVESEQSSVIATGRNFFARSEGDVTTTSMTSHALPTIRFERNIGDSPDVVASSSPSRLPRTATYPDSSSFKHDSNKISDYRLPCERARAIFAQIVNGDAIIHLRGS